MGQVNGTSNNNDPGAPFPKFALHRCALNANFGNKGALATQRLLCGFEFEVPERARGNFCRNFKFAALMPTERPDADAPVPPNGTEQAAAEPAAQQSTAQPPQQQPAEQSSTADNIAGDIVSDVADVIGSIILSLLDD